MMGCDFSKLSHGGVIDKTKITVDECDPKQLVSACRAVPELGPLGALLKAKGTAMTDPKLQSLAEEHFKSTVAAARLLSSLELRLSEARARRSLLLEAVQCCYYEEDGKEVRAEKLKEYFEGAAGDARAADTRMGELDAVCERHRSTCREAGLVMDEAEGKLSSTERWRKLWRTATCSAAALAAAACAVSFVFPCDVALAAAAAGAACTAAKMAEKWMELPIWGQRRLRALAAEKDVAATIWRGRFDVHELESVRAVARRLEIRMGSMSLAAELALLREEEDAAAVAMAMEEVERKMGAVEESMKLMEMKVDSCFNEIKTTITQLLNIIKAT